MKAIVAVAGIGTRLLPITKEMPKEMLPVPVRGENGELYFKPILHALVEQIYKSGIKEICFITGRGKWPINDYFTPDYEFLGLLKQKGKITQYNEMKRFYDMLEDLEIYYVSQPQPKGFGEAFVHAHSFAKDERFFACAGDSYVIPDNNWLKQMLETSEKLKNASVIISARRVSMEKAKQLGVIIGEEVEPGIVKVKKVVEKPEKPPSNLVINAFYIFDPMIFRALEKLEFNKKGEKEVTDAIQKIIDWGFDVYATVLNSNKYYLVDIGKVETYLEAIEKFNQMTKKKQ